MSPHHNHNQQAEEPGLALDAEDVELLREAEENPDALVTDTPNDQKLKTFSVICIIVNRMIGSGIFSTPSTIVRATDSVPVALIFWIIGSLITFMALCVYLELGLSIPKYKLRGRGDRMVSVPRSGGEKNYLEYMFPKPRYLATCVYAIIFICVGNTAGNAITFAQNFLQMINVDQPKPAVIRGVAIGIITLACLLHTAWRAAGIAVNNFLATIKVAILLVIICAGFAAYGGAIPAVTENSFHSGVTWERSNTYGYAEAFLAVIFSYGGYMNANYVLSEVHKPQKTLKKGAFTAVGLVSLLYILTNAAYFAAVPKDDLVNAGAQVAVKFFRTVFGGHVAAERVLPGLIALSSLGNIVVVTFVASRVKAEIAKEGVIPFSRFFAANTPTLLTRFFRRKAARMGDDDQQHSHLQAEQAPAGALLLHWIFSMIIIVSPPMGDTYDFFVNLYSYTINCWIGFFLAAGLLYLRFKPHSTWVGESSFKPWGGPTMTIIYLIFNAFLIAAPWTGADIEKKNRLSISSIPPYVFPTVGTGLFVVGALYWVLFRYVWPKVYKRELHQTRIPILLDGVQVHEIVICSWVVPGMSEPEEAEMKAW
ncbi:amino acid transporter [Wilcoxina mikolae CBS 423.85]|nr:amino acid transporter [Wilcoxina mikolae CBS 423.85]